MIYTRTSRVKYRDLFCLNSFMFRYTFSTCLSVIRFNRLHRFDYYKFIIRFCHIYVD
ncbi:hypothetical protein Hanom_Chr15g01387801 [Helianthus anomalus]